MLISTNGKYYRNGAEISAGEYIRVLRLLQSRPDVPAGYGCRFTADDEWELYELPVEEEAAEELGGAT